MARPAEESQIRTCGTCTLCCRLPEIEALAKEADAWCVNCTPGHGCKVYDSRPATCREFLCSWMTDPAVTAEWQPLRSHMMVYEQGPQVTVLVDPDHPHIWKSETYLPQLQDWAAAAEKRGGYMILFCGEEIVRIEPARA